MPAVSKKVHILILALASLVVLASLLLEPGQDGVSLLGRELPSSCTLKRLTGWGCPGCGLTRSFAYMAHLQVREAWEMHLLGPAGWLAVAVQVPYRGWRIWRGEGG